MLSSGLPHAFHLSMRFLCKTNVVSVSTQQTAKLIGDYFYSRKQAGKKYILHLTHIVFWRT
jgi:hypothetical protein